MRSLSARLGHVEFVGSLSVAAAMLYSTKMVKERLESKKPRSLRQFVTHTGHQQCAEDRRVDDDEAADADD